MISDLIGLGKFFADWAGSIGSARRDRRQRVADLLTSISDCMTDITRTARTESRVPQDRCAELITYKNALLDVIERTVGGESARSLHLLVLDAYQIPYGINYLMVVAKHQGGRLPPPGEGGNHVNWLLDELDRVAGSLRASANLIRAK